MLDIFILEYLEIMKPTSDMTQQMLKTHWVTASLLPLTVTARSVELGNISEATFSNQKNDWGLLPNLLLEKKLVLYLNWGSCNFSYFFDLRSSFSNKWSTLWSRNNEPESDRRSRNGCRWHEGGQILEKCYNFFSIRFVWSNLVESERKGKQTIL